MSVWDDVVDQDHVVAGLQEATAAADARLRGGDAGGMSHAWLFTGPPGSGRSNLARAFAAALQCPRLGCGSCQACRTALAGSHPDIEVLSTETLSFGVEATRTLVRRSMMTPSGGRWQVIIMEDADRLTERAANALLKTLEEPSSRTVWMLCAPSTEDILPTIRSRTRHVLLRTPSAEAVTEVLVRRDHIDRAVAAFAARAGQGHIGRARHLAVDETARARRREVLSLPTTLRDVGSCMTAAQNLVDAAADEAKAATAESDTRETADLRRALGLTPAGKVPPAISGQLKDLETRQKKRATRAQRDALDRALVDLVSFYRDVLAVQMGAGVTLTNEELRADVESVARGCGPDDTLRRIDAVLACRERIHASVQPLLAVEAMMLALRTG